MYDTYYVNVTSKRELLGVAILLAYALMTYDRVTVSFDISVTTGEQARTSSRFMAKDVHHSHLIVVLQVSDATEDVRMLGNAIRGELSL